LGGQTADLTNRSEMRKLFRERSNRNQALKMTVKTVDDYLFVEAGGFNSKHPVDWRPPLYVMKRQTK
jgi:hypothetical protein